MKEKCHPKTTEKEINDCYVAFIKNHPRGISVDELMKNYNEEHPENQKGEKQIRRILVKLQECGSVALAKDRKHSYHVFHPVKDPIVIEETIETKPTEDTPKPPTPKQTAFRNFVESLVSKEVDGETYRLETTQWRQIHEEAS